MPRCQWCRQESQNANICDWCKRPLAAGWTPAAVPADKMSFAATATDEPRSDRLLMISMLGIVVMTALAFGISLMGHKNLPSVQPAVPQVTTPAQKSAPQYTDNRPVPAPQPQNYQSEPDPVPTAPDPPQYQPDPGVALQDNPPPQQQTMSGDRPRNPKIAFIRDLTAVN